MAASNPVLPQLTRPPRPEDVEGQAELAINQVDQGAAHLVTGRCSPGRWCYPCKWVSIRRHRTNL